jgi:hypothetical protein
MFSIFHTSSCGSTLLACLLSKSISSYSEPDWVTEIFTYKDLNEKIERAKECHKPNTLVKYSSLVCEIAPHIEGKKVFLYRNLEDHIKKKQECGCIVGSVAHEAKLWHKRFGYILDSDNVLFIEANHFFDNQQEVVKKVCDHFGIEYIPIEIDFHVKKAGYHHTNIPINI